jgi:hypothetical protein
MAQLIATLQLPVGNLEIIMKEKSSNCLDFSTWKMMF